MCVIWASLEHLHNLLTDFNLVLDEEWEKREKIEIKKKMISIYDDSHI